jgi:hypothetical protein
MIIMLMQFAGRDAPSLVISFAQKTLKDGNIISKLHVIELGGAVPGALLFSPGLGRIRTIDVMDAI